MTTFSGGNTGSQQGASTHELSRRERRLRELAMRVAGYDWGATARLWSRTGGTPLPVEAPLPTVPVPPAPARPVAPVRRRRHRPTKESPLALKARLTSARLAHTGDKAVPRGTLHGSRFVATLQPAPRA
jgi:hypothetical protein